MPVTGIPVTAPETELKTINQIVQHLLGELNQSRTTGVGNVPDRLTHLVALAYRELWTAQEWVFRMRRGTLTLAAGSDTALIVPDCAKIDATKLHEEGGSGTMALTSDRDFFEDFRRAHRTSTGRPQLAYMEPAAQATHRLQARVCPTPDQAYTYIYPYYCYAPALDSGATPLWPDYFNAGWLLSALYRVLRAFRKDSAWKAAMADYEEWLAGRIKDNETVVSSTEAIRDANNDIGCTTSAMMGMGG